MYTSFTMSEQKARIVNKQKSTPATKGKAMVHSPSEIDIFQACKKEQGFATDSAFAEALGVSRQSLYQWLNGVHKPSTDLLKLMALVNMPVKPWKATLAISLLKARNMQSEIPCTCQSDGSVNPFCPKHFESVAEKA